MKLIYFAWVREQVGIDEENVDLPATIKTIADLLAWLPERGDNYAIFEQAHALRAAINQEHVDHDTLITDAQEIAIFPPMTGG
ncbi:MAG: molybdopterin converting factor subunit 1 [Hyphomicrobiales bacterium]